MQTGLFSIFKDHPELLVAFSERSDGSMLLPETHRGRGYPEAAELTQRNRERAFIGIDISPERTISAALIHGAQAHEVDEGSAGSALIDTDGLVTNACDLFLSLTVADCLPVFLYDPTVQVVGLAHAGWRGLAGGIIPATVKKMINETGARPENILAAVGPGISACHFSVTQETVDALSVYVPEALQERDSTMFLDLKLIAQRQLERAGILPEHTEISKECTACLPEKYFSWRRDRPEPIETMIAVIGRRCG